MATNIREHEGERRAFECTRFLFNFIIFILCSASLLQALGLQSNCWLCRCAGVKIGRESCDNSLHQLSVRARDPPLTVTTHHHHPHGRLCNAQPSELSAALVTASNKSFYFSLLAGWGKAVNGTTENFTVPKEGPYYWDACPQRS